MHDGIHDPAYQNRIAVLRNLLIWELDGREEGYTDGSVLFANRTQQAVLEKKKEK